MFIDKEYWTYLNEEPLRSELKLGTKLFSLNNKKEFLDYLDAIRAIATPERLTIVQELYGDGCLTPYTSDETQSRSYFIKCVQTSGLRFICPVLLVAPKFPLR